MPRNSSGVYTLPAGNPVVTGTTITSSWANPTMSDLANEVTNSLDRAGRGSMTGQLKAIDGTVSAPGMTFGAELSSGWYRSAAGVVRLSILAAQVAQFNASGLELVGKVGVGDGAVGTPSIYAVADPDSGWYFSGANEVSGSAGGVQAFKFDATTVTSVLPHLLAAGTAAAPALAFSADSNTGLFSAAANVIGFATDGALKFQVNATPGVHIGDSALDAASSSVGAYNRSRLVSATTTQYGLFENTRFSLNATGAAYGAYVASRFEDGAYTTVAYYGTRITNPTLGAGQSLTNQVGLYVDALTAGATTRYGIRSLTAAASGAWNLYIDGDAQNYLAGRLGIGVSVPTSELDVLGNVLITNAGQGQLQIVGTDSGASGPRFTIFHDSPSPAVNDVIGEVRFNGRDSAAVATIYGQIFGKIIDPTNGSETGQIEFRCLNAGASSVPLYVAQNEAVLADSDHLTIRAVGTRGSEPITRNATQAFGLSDSGKTITKTNTTAYTWTINPDATTSFPIGAIIQLLHDSTAGNITIARGAGVALINGTTDANQTITAGNGASIQKISANRWRYRG